MATGAGAISGSDDMHSLYGRFLRQCSRVPGLPPKIKTRLVEIVNSLSFEVFAMAVVIANAVVLSLDHYDMTYTEMVRVGSQATVIV